jgi:hypothetical protein
MLTKIDVPWPLSTSPGQRPQEGAGRLINVFAEPRGEGLPAVYHRVPGASVFARIPSVGTAQGDAIALAVGSS